VLYENLIVLLPKVVLFIALIGISTQINRLFKIILRIRQIYLE